MKVKVTQSCPALCNPMDYTVHGILQARILEWAAFPFSWDPGIEPKSSTLQADSLPAEPIREACKVGMVLANQDPWPLWCGCSLQG